jgi:hypothetical protein
MESMPAPAMPVTIGIDTHLEVHVAAVIDQAGRLLGTQTFPASTRGYVALVTWAESFGPVERIGVEGTGTFGAGLTRFVRAYGLAVVEVARPDRSMRRRWGKSDPIDAQAAARATLAGVAVTTPKIRDGQVEMIRLLRVARRGAMKATVAAAEQLYGVLYSAPGRAAPATARTHDQGAGQGVRGDAARAADQPNGRHQDHPADPGAPLAATPGRARPARHPAAGAGHLGRARAGRPAPGWESRPLASCWSPPATTPSGWAPKPPSRICAAPPPSQPPRVAPTATG